MIHKLFHIIQRDGIVYTAKRIFAFIFAKAPTQLSFRYYNATRLVFAPSSLTYVMFASPSSREHDIRIITDKLSTGSVMIDVGGNIGSVAIAAATHVGPTGQVITFEPSPKFHAIINQNIALNKFADRIKAHQVALGAHDATVHLDETVADDTTNVISTTGTEVQQHTLDRYTADLTLVDVLKIDVEGYELEVLKGATETLKKTKYLYIEFIPDNLKQCNVAPEDILTILTQHFSLHTVTDGTVAPFTYNPAATHHPDLFCINTSLQ